MTGYIAGVVVLAIVATIIVAGIRFSENRKNGHKSLRHQFALFGKARQR
jgi:hypothetical protein